MKIRLPLMASFLLVAPLAPLALFAQTSEQLESYLKRFPDADANGDGKLSREEARGHRQQSGRAQAPSGRLERDPSEGDNLASRSNIPGIRIDESVSPVTEVELRSADGVDLSFVYRAPSGKSSRPAILFFHGGGGMSGLEGLKSNLLNQPIQTRFLERGYITIACTRRPFWETPQDGPTGFYDAVEDAALIVEKAKTLPGVNPDQVILYGGSGGGILAIATAAKADVACVIAGEPATVVPIDPREGERATPANYQEVMEDPHKFYTPERKKEMLAWMKRIQSPVLVLQGEPVGLYKTNFEILIPEMKKLGKGISSIQYPGVTHGFYWGSTGAGATIETVESILRDVTAYIESHTGAF